MTKSVPAIVTVNTAPASWFRVTIVNHGTMNKPPKYGRNTIAGSGAGSKRTRNSGQAAAANVVCRTASTANFASSSRRRSTGCVSSMASVP